MSEPLNITRERFSTPEEIAATFRRSVQWVYNNALPAKLGPEDEVLRKAGILFPAARRFNARTLLFDREAVERIILAARNT